MTRAEQARENFFKGYTCAQAVLLAFADDLHIGEEALFALSAASRPFGGGMGRLRLTCGCVSGGAMALGLFAPDLPKSELYALVQQFAEAFRRKNGSIICGQLLTGSGIQTDTSPAAEPRTEEYYRRRPCPSLIYDGAEILETLLKERGFLQERG